MLWGPRSSRTPVILAAAVVFVAVCVLPLLFMLSAAFVEPRQVVGVIQDVLLDRRQGRLLSNTILLGLGTAALATLVGVPLGFGLARFELRFKAALRLALVAPAVLPPYVVALALIYVGGNLASTLGGAIVALTIVLYPLAMLATGRGGRPCRHARPGLEEDHMAAHRSECSVGGAGHLRARHLRVLSSRPASCSRLHDRSLYCLCGVV